MRGLLTSRGWGGGFDEMGLGGKLVSREADNEERDGRGGNER